ncbi:phenylacetaldehyde dehydrogenase [Burkholderia pseudomallei Pakistan 9]|nr:phenylacetaldehyde dehydrogenase [Burkholderia pseudomallei Pakistan 9]
MTQTDLVAVADTVRAFTEREFGVFIDGAMRAAHSPRRLDVFDPATGARLSRVPDADAHDVDAAVASAQRAFDARAWSGLRPAERERILLKLADVLEAHAEELAQLETLNQGKSILVSRGVEVGATIEYVRYMAGWATKITGQTLDVSIPFPPGARYTAYTRKEPVGVVAAIVPWNFPLMIAVWKLVPALAAGCTVVLKPSPETPLTALRLAELALEAGVPAGVFNVVTGARACGAALASHPAVRKISFTGSTATGKLVGAAAVQNMTRFSLELGGKNPIVMLEDVDVDAALGGVAAGAFFNQGQVCAAASRIYVHRSRFRRLAEGLAGVASAMRLGPGLDPGRADQPARVRAPSRHGRPAHRRSPPRRPHVPRGRHPRRRSARLFRAPGGDRRCGARQRDRARRGVRPGGRRAAVRRSGRGGAARERVAVRARREPVEQRPEGGDGPRAADRGGHRLGQLPHSARSVDAVRRLQAIGHRPRVRPIRDRRLHRNQIRLHRALNARTVRFFPGAMQ